MQLQRNRSAEPKPRVTGSGGKSCGNHPVLLALVACVQLDQRALDDARVVGHQSLGCFDDRLDAPEPCVKIVQASLRFAARVLVLRGGSRPGCTVQVPAHAAADTDWRTMHAAPWSDSARIIRCYQRPGESEIYGYQHPGASQAAIQFKALNASGLARAFKESRVRNVRS